MRGRFKSTYPPRLDALYFGYAPLNKGVGGLAARIVSPAAQPLQCVT